jgi:hypothetical protein
VARRVSQRPRRETRRFARRGRCAAQGHGNRAAGARVASGISRSRRVCSSISTTSRRPTLMQPGNRAVYRLLVAGSVPKRHALDPTRLAATHASSGWTEDGERARSAARGSPDLRAREVPRTLGARRRDPRRGSRRARRVATWRHPDAAAMLRCFRHREAGARAIRAAIRRDGLRRARAGSSSRSAASNSS